MARGGIERDIEIRVRAWNEAQRALTQVAAELKIVEKVIEQVTRVSSEASIEAAVLTHNLDREAQEAGALALRIQALADRTGKLTYSGLLLGRSLEVIDNKMKQLELTADLGAIATERLAKEEEKLAVAAEAAALFQSRLDEEVRHTGEAMLFTAADADVLAKMLEKDAAATELLNGAQRRGAAGGQIWTRALRLGFLAALPLITLISPLSLIVGGLAVAFASIALTVGAAAGALGLFGYAVYSGMKALGAAGGVANQFEKSLQQIQFAGAIAGTQLEQHFFGPTGQGFQKLTTAAVALIQHITPIVQKFGDQLIAFFQKWGPTILSIVQAWAQLLTTIFGGVGGAIMNLFVKLQPLAMAIVRDLAQMLKTIFIQTKNILTPLIPLTIQFVNLLTKGIAGAVGLYQQFGATLDFVGVAILKLAIALLPAFQSALTGIIPIMKALGFVIAGAANALGWFATHFKGFTSFIIWVTLLGIAFIKLKNAIMGLTIVKLIAGFFSYNAVLAKAGLETLTFGQYLGRAAPALSRFVTVLKGATVAATGFLTELGSGSLLAGLTRLAGGFVALAAPLITIEALMRVNTSHLKENAQATYDYVKAQTGSNLAGQIAMGTWRGMAVASAAAKGQIKGLTDATIKDSVANAQTTASFEKVSAATISYQQALQQAGVAQNQWNAIIKKAGTLTQGQQTDLRMLAKVSGTSYAAIMASAQQAADQMRTNGQAWNQFTQSQIQNWNNFRNSVQQALGGGAAALQQFSGAAHVSLGQVDKSLRTMIAQQRSVFKDWETILKKGGAAAKPLVAALAQMGLNGLALSKTLAHSTAPQIANAARLFGIADANASNFSKSIAGQLLGTLQQLNNILLALAIKLSVKLTPAMINAAVKAGLLSDSVRGAAGQMSAGAYEAQNLTNKLNNIPRNIPVNVNVKIQTQRFYIPGKGYVFQHGGVIQEHVIGFGTESGKRYDLGESGNEVVTPVGKTPQHVGAPGPVQPHGDTHLHFYEAHPKPEDIINDLTWWSRTHGWSN